MESEKIGLWSLRKKRKTMESEKKGLWSLKI
jgi:hypothetical protein